MGDMETLIKVSFLFHFKKQADARTGPYASNAISRETAATLFVRENVLLRHARALIDTGYFCLSFHLKMIGLPQDFR
jgi:hypothetical protein